MIQLEKTVKRPIIETVVDRKEQTALFVVTGNFGNFRDADNPIIEMFRAVNHSLMLSSRKNRRVMHYALYLPHFDEKKNNTMICVRLNAATYIPRGVYTPDAKLAQMGKFMEEDISEIKKQLEKLVEKFSEIPEGYSLYIRRLEELDKATNADVRTAIQEEIKIIIKNFLKANGYEPVSTSILKSY